MEVVHSLLLVMAACLSSEVGRDMELQEEGFDFSAVCLIKLLN